MNAELFIQRVLWQIQITTVKSIKISRNSEKKDLTLAILNKLNIKRNQYNEKWLMTIITMIISTIILNWEKNIEYEG